MTKLEDWRWDSQATYFCPYCGAEVFNLTYTQQVCFKCRRVFKRPEYIARIYRSDI